MSLQSYLKFHSILQYWSWIAVATLLVTMALVGCRPEEPTESPDPNTLDSDDDGYNELQGDCNDKSPTVYPGADETCRNLGTDNDCDGTGTDSKDESEAIDPATWYRDSDGDGYGASSSIQMACVQPDGFVELGGDCNDADVNYHPGATEVDCSGTDDLNCDGSTGDVDADLDGVVACQDCNDSDAAMYPGGEEVCNKADDDCDLNIDEDPTDGSVYYADQDTDGYGSLSNSTVACEVPEDYTTRAGDCNDNSSYIHPGADEICNESDDDCDGTVDDNAENEATWYLDLDSDGYGQSTETKTSCSAPEGYANIGGDCDDDDPSIHPAAAEVCNAIDDDCDGDIDATDGSVSCAYSLSFDGGDFVTIPSTDDQYLGNAFTLAAWVNTAACATGSCDQAFISKHTCGGFLNGYYLGLFTGGYAQFYVNGVRIYSPTPIRSDNGTWHHIAATYSSGILSLYVDGISVATGTGANTVDSTDSFSLGSSDGNCNYFVGLLDEVQAWKEARTTEEIQSDMTGILSITEAEKDLLLFYYTFDQQSSQVIEDQSASDYDGIIGADNQNNASDPSWVVGGPW